MDYSGYVSVTLAVGILWSLFYTRKTGWGCGGLLTPGLLALKVNMPLSFFNALASGILVAFVLKILSKRFLLYGRERVGVALLLALGLRLLLRDRGLLFDDYWIGWAAAGLLAADADRQGIRMTLAGAVSCSIITAMSMALITHMGRTLL